MKPEIVEVVNFRAFGEKVKAWSRGTDPLPQLTPAQHVAPVRIVVIEDDDAMREMVATALRLKGYQVRTAGDGLAGLRLLDAYEPDLVVLDLGLPIVSGLDVVNELRAVAKTRRTPLIAISGQDQQLRLAKDTNEFMATIAKPFDPQTLVRAVDRVMKQPGL